MGHKDKKASHSTNDHYSRHRDNNRDESHHKKEDQQHRRQKNSLHGPSKGIEAAKNRLKASLTTAISDLSHEQTSNGQAMSQIRSEGNSFDILEDINRQAAIELIEEDEGFKPTSFYSTSNNYRAGKHIGDDSQKDHDRAMFGAAWVGKELEKKQPSGAVTLEKACTAEVNVDTTKSNFTMAMAHERLSEDPEIRQKRWIALFLKRRKECFETYSLRNQTIGQ